MITKLNTNICSCAIVLILIALICVRLVTPNEENTWINIINYIGFLIAFFSLFFNSCTEYRKCRKVRVLAGTFVLILIPLVIVGVLIFTNIIVPDSRINDVIMLVTLLISLPAQFHIKLIGHYMKE